MMKIGVLSEQSLDRLNWIRDHGFGSFQWNRFQESAIAHRADASKFVVVFNFIVLCKEGNTFSSTVSGSDPARAHKRQPKEKIPFSPQIE